MAKNKKAGSGKKKGGMRKRGRMLVWCQNYRSSYRRIRNKKVKLTKHIAKHPNDQTAHEAINRIKT